MFERGDERRELVGHISGVIWGKFAYFVGDNANSIQRFLFLLLLLLEMRCRPQVCPLTFQHLRHKASRWLIVPQMSHLSLLPSTHSYIPFGRCIRSGIFLVFSGFTRINISKFILGQFFLERIFTSRKDSVPYRQHST